MFLAGNLTVFSSFISGKVATVDCLKKHCYSGTNNNAAARSLPCRGEEGRLYICGMESCRLYWWGNLGELCLPGSGAPWHQHAGLSALVNPREDRARSTCGGQASQTHSWGSCIYDRHFLCHFRVTWQMRSWQLRSPSFRKVVLLGNSV